MSAGDGNAVPSVSRDIGLLAPRFAAAVQRAVAAANAAGMDAMVFEAFRSNELQALYYKRGRTVRPPFSTVTNARTSEFSWHGYGLAVDVISKKHLWKPPGGEAWFRDLSNFFKAEALTWGGDWTHPDTPHFQWGRCKPSPSDIARHLLRTEGVEAVWRAVSAD